MFWYVALGVTSLIGFLAGCCVFATRKLATGDDEASYD
jgi:hypothetical protein